MSAAYAPVNLSAPICLAPPEVAARCGWSLAYVYKQAKQHKWRRVAHQGRVYYWTADVDAARKSVPAGRLGTNPFERHGDGTDAA